MMSIDTDINSLELLLQESYLSSSDIRTVRQIDCEEMYHLFHDNDAEHMHPHPPKSSDSSWIPTETEVHSTFKKVVPAMTDIEEIYHMFYDNDAEHMHPHPPNNSGQLKFRRQLNMLEQIRVESPSSELDLIRFVKPPKYRNDVDLDVLCSATKWMPLFLYLPSVHRQFCKAATLEIYSDGDILFEVNSIADSYFLVASGAICITLAGATSDDQSPRKTNPPENSRTTNGTSTILTSNIVELGSGSGIGEMALISASRMRNGTASSKRGCTAVLLRLNLSDYDRLLRDYHIDIYIKRLEFWKKVPLFRNWSLQRLLQLTYDTRFAEFSDGDMVLTSGTPAESLCWLINGHLLVTRGYLFPDDVVHNEPVSTISAGEMFGEIGCFLTGTRTANVTVISERASVIQCSYARILSVCDDVDLRCLAEMRIEASVKFSQSLGCGEPRNLALIGNQLDWLAPLVKSVCPKLSDDALKFVLGASRLITFRAGDVLYRAGDIGQYAYIVVDGSVNLCHSQHSLNSPNPHLDANTYSQCLFCVSPCPNSSKNYEKKRAFVHQSASLHHARILPVTKPTRRRNAIYFSSPHDAVTLSNALVEFKRSITAGFPSSSCSDALDSETTESTSVTEPSTVFVCSSKPSEATTRPSHGLASLPLALQALHEPPAPGIEFYDRAVTGEDHGEDQTSNEFFSKFDLPSEIRMPWLEIGVGGLFGEEALSLWGLSSLHHPGHELDVGSSHQDRFADDLIDMFQSWNSKISSHQQRLVSCSEVQSILGHFHQNASSFDAVKLDPHNSMWSQYNPVLAHLLRRQSEVGSYLFSAKINTATSTVLVLRRRDYLEAFGRYHATQFREKMTTLLASGVFAALLPPSVSIAPPSNAKCVSHRRLQSTIALVGLAPPPINGLTVARLQIQKILRFTPVAAVDDAVIPSPTLAELHARFLGEQFPPIVVTGADRNMMQMAALFTPLSFTAGTVLITQDHASCGLFVIMNGECAVLRNEPHGVTQTPAMLNILGPTQMFGESSLLESSESEVVPLSPGRFGVPAAVRRAGQLPIRTAILSHMSRNREKCLSGNCFRATVCPPAAPSFYNFVLPKSDSSELLTSRCDAYMAVSAGATSRDICTYRPPLSISDINRLISHVNLTSVAEAEGYLQSCAVAKPLAGSQRSIPSPVSIIAKTALSVLFISASDIVCHFPTASVGELQQRAIEKLGEWKRNPPNPISFHINSESYIRETTRGSTVPLRVGASLGRFITKQFKPSITTSCPRVVSQAPNPSHCVPLLSGPLITDVTVPQGLSTGTTFSNTTDGNALTIAVLSSGPSELSTDPKFRMRKNKTEETDDIVRGSFWKKTTHILLGSEPKKHSVRFNLSNAQKIKGPLLSIAHQTVIGKTLCNSLLSDGKPPSASSIRPSSLSDAGI